MLVRDVAEVVVETSVTFVTLGMAVEIKGEDDVDGVLDVVTVLVIVIILKMVDVPVIVLFEGSSALMLVQGSQLVVKARTSRSMSYLR